MSLQIFWFLAIAILWTGFFVLEGFDFGVGVLHKFLGRTDDEQRVLINSIGPFWDGNEVWLIVGGAGIFAAFPGWYATWFSAGYLALLLILVALMIRGVSFEYRGKVGGGRWRNSFSWCLVVGSLLAPLLLGVALGDLLAGLPIDKANEFTGNFFDLLTPYGLLTGVTVLVLCLLHGATFIGIRTDGVLQARAHSLAAKLAPAALVLVAVFGVGTVVVADRGVARGIVLPLLAVVALAIAMVDSRAGKDIRAFAATAFAIGATIVTIFLNLYPNVMISSTSSAYTLTVSGTASNHYALAVMTVVALIFLPVVLVYQTWTYVVFRRRLRTPGEPEPANPLVRNPGS